MVRNHLQTLTIGQSRRAERRQFMAEKENIEHVERDFGLINDECTDIFD